MTTFEKAVVESAISSLVDFLLSNIILTVNLLNLQNDSLIVTNVLLLVIIYLLIHLKASNRTEHFKKIKLTGVLK